MFACMSVLTSLTAAIFPGQGVALGGTRALVLEHCAREHEHCSEMLDRDPFEGAAESTRFAQPAIFLASIASWRTLEGPAPLAFAGHSLGELSALTAAGTLGVDDALALVVLRGALMAEAGERRGDGCMLALLGGDVHDAEELAGRYAVVIANDNAPGQTVLSGAREALQGAAAAARAQGLRAIALDVSGAFHSPEMEPARAPFLEALKKVRILEPCSPVLSGMTAAPFQDVRGELALALARPVRWRQTMHALRAHGARHFLDVGPDRVLARLAQRNLDDVEVEVEAHELHSGAHA